MKFQEAKRYIVRFGKHAGRTLDQIGSTDGGLKYLDWLRGWEGVRPDTKEAVDAYLNHPPIARELDDLIGGDG